MASQVYVFADQVHGQPAAIALSGELFCLKLESGAQLLSEHDTVEIKRVADFTATQAASVCVAGAAASPTGGKGAAVELDEFGLFRRKAFENALLQHLSRERQVV